VFPFVANVCTSRLLLLLSSPLSSPLHPSKPTQNKTPLLWRFVFTHQKAPTK
jgi:hypothetical protein